MADHRRQRVEHLVRGELGTLLLREVKDPRLGAVTISDVRMTADLREARVFYRILQDGVDAADVARALVRATPFLRVAVGRSLGLRVTPGLQFEYDTTPDTARRVEELLRNVEHHGGDDDE